MMVGHIHLPGWWQKTLQIRGAHDYKHAVARKSWGHAPMKRIAELDTFWTKTSYYWTRTSPQH